MVNQFREIALSPIEETNSLYGSGIQSQRGSMKKKSNGSNATNGNSSNMEGKAMSFKDVDTKSQFKEMERHIGSSSQTFENNSDLRRHSEGGTSKIILSNQGEDGSPRNGIFRNDEESEKILELKKIDEDRNEQCE